jgi:hypothetical protein
MATVPPMRGASFFPAVVAALLEGAQCCVSTQIRDQGGGKPVTLPPGRAIMDLDQIP